MALKSSHRKCSDLFLAFIVAKILNDASLEQKFLAFLQSQNFDQKSQDFIRDLEAGAARVQEITLIEKQYLRQFVSMVFSKLHDLSVDEKSKHNCFFWFGPNAQETHLKDALNGIAGLACNMYDKTENPFPIRWDDQRISQDVVADLLQKTAHSIPSLQHIEKYTVVRVEDASQTYIAEHTNHQNIDTKRGTVITFGINSGSFDTVVLKHKKFKQSDQSLWKNEKEVLKQLASIPNVLKPITYVENPNEVCMILPPMGFFYANNPHSVWRDLFECFADVPLTLLKLGLVQHYFSELLHVVDHLHRVGIFHRDLKPENVMLDGRGTIKLGDFEFATNEEKPSRLEIGTTGFLHPNFQSCKFNLNLDLWALGATLYSLSTDKTLTNKKHAYKDDGLKYASDALNEPFSEQISENSERVIKLIIQDLTLSPLKSKKNDHVIREILTRTNAWKLNDSERIAMLLQLPKEKPQAS